MSLYHQKHFYISFNIEFVDWIIITDQFLRPRSHYSVFVSIRFCCIEATVHITPFLCVHTDLPDNKNVAKNIRFCAFTLLRFCEANCWILERFQKPPSLCVHINQMGFQKPPFLWISTFDSNFENLRFCGVFVRISANTFTKTEVFSLRFCTKTE